MGAVVLAGHSGLGKQWIGGLAQAGPPTYPNFAAVEMVDAGRRRRKLRVRKTLLRICLPTSQTASGTLFEESGGGLERKNWERSELGQVRYDI